jgi:tetratricopeptide (TPR) repeat protein/predicted Ser/Thr protein kinase
MIRLRRPRRERLAPPANDAISSAREPTLSTSDTPPNPVEGDSTTLGVAPENVPTPGESGIEKARLKASLMGKLFGATPAAVKIGRFRVLDHVGEGGMGTIYSAYDDQLDRKVAVKVLHTNLGRGARERLMREAKALAQLSHPNVVTVHEVGEHEDSVFVAMEFVRGSTLRAWRTAAERSVAEILEVYAQAARGLAAAHAAGLVHRDFKPDNALVGEDGRVRVVDFGLARVEGAAMETSDGEPSAETTDRGRLTLTGTVMGTPLYMAPEQHEGADADARSDQFSFCVALWQALYGEHPFPHETIGELVAAVGAGRRQAPPREPTVPAAMRKALERGLATDPSERHASMDALLENLAPELGGPSRARRWAVGLFTAALGAGVAFAMVGREPSQFDELCKPVDERLAGVWDEQTRKDLAQHYAGSPEYPWVARSAEVFAEEIDRWADEWTTSYEDACEQLQGTEDTSFAVHRLDCLDGRLQELDAVRRAAEQSEPEKWAQQFQGWLRVQPLRVCDDANALRGVPSLPRDPVRRAEARKIRGDVWLSLALLTSSDFKSALPLAQRAASAAERLDDPAIEAEALFVLAAAEENSNTPEVLTETRARALSAAERASHDWVLFNILAYSDHPGDAQRARVLASRVNPTGLKGPVGLQYANDDGFVEQQLSLLAQSERDFGRLAGPTLSRVNEAARSLGSRANYRPERTTNDNTAAVALRGDFIQRTEERLGPNHPRVAAETYNMVNALEKLNRYEEGLHHLSIALGSVGKNMPEGNPLEATIRFKMSDLYRSAGQLRNSKDAGQRAASIYRELGDKKSADDAYSNVTWYAFWHGDHDSVVAWAAAQDPSERPEAAYMLAFQQDDLAARRTLEGMLPEHVALRVLAELIVAIESRDGEAMRERADAMTEILGDRSLHGEIHMGGYILAEWQALTGKAYLLAGDPSSAVKPLEEAVVSLARFDEELCPIADGHFYLGRALWETGGDRERALTLARRGVEIYDTLGPGWAAERDAARAWLAKHDR